MQEYVQHPDILPAPSRSLSHKHSTSLNCITIIRVHTFCGNYYCGYYLDADCLCMHQISATFCGQEIKFSTQKCINKYNFVPPSCGTAAGGLWRNKKKQCELNCSSQAIQIDVAIHGSVRQRDEGGVRIYIHFTVHRSKFCNTLLKSLRSEAFLYATD